MTDFENIHAKIQMLLIPGRRKVFNQFLQPHTLQNMKCYLSDLITFTCNLHNHFILKALEYFLS